MSRGTCCSRARPVDRTSLFSPIARMATLLGAQPTHWVLDLAGTGTAAPCFWTPAALSFCVRRPRFSYARQPDSTSKVLERERERKSDSGLQPRWAIPVGAQSGIQMGVAWRQNRARRATCRCGCPRTARRDHLGRAIGSLPISIWWQRQLASRVRSHGPKFRSTFPAKRDIRL
jgi:hypothetical protein